MKSSFAISILLMLLISGCWDEKPVTITKDYVINPNWKKDFDDGNSLAIYKMQLKDSSQSIDLKDPSEAELYHGLIKDTRFAYTANVNYNGTDYSKRKVYFNRDNGFVWRKPPDIAPSRNITFKTIGELQQETWYLLTGLSQIHTTMYYIYLNSLDSLHVFKVSTMTNY